MRRPFGVKWIRFGFCWTRFLPTEPLSPCFHRTLEHVDTLGAHPVRRPAFSSHLITTFRMPICLWGPDLERHRVEEIQREFLLSRNLIGF